MTCQWSNGFVNSYGVMGLEATRPLAAFFLAPRPTLMPHWQKPSGDVPHSQTIPVGPQYGPGFTPVVGIAGPTYDPPDLANDGWVPGGVAMRLGA